MADASLTGTHSILEMGAAPASVAATPGQSEYVEGRAVLAYESMLDHYDVSITASSETSGYAAVNVKSRLTHSGWRPSAGGAQYLYFTATDLGVNVNYLLIAGHDLASKGATIDLSYSDDGGANWTSMLNGGYAPSSDAPFMLLPTAQAKMLFRLTVNVQSADYPTIAVVMLGPRLDLQRGIYVGHRPAPFSRQVQFDNQFSEGGQFLGRSVVRRLNETVVTLKRITPAWYRAYLKAFELAAEEEPFGFMWNTDDRYKGEVMFAFMDGSPRPVNEHQSFMAVEYQLRGLA